MKTYTIIKSEKKDLEIACQFFEEAIKYQKRKGYPSYVIVDREAIKKDIEMGRHYKLISQNEIGCVFSITYSDKMAWREKDRDKAIYLHRILVNPKHKGQMHLGKIMNWTTQLAKQQGIERIRLDTWDHNPDLINYYKRFGFEIAEHSCYPNTKEYPINCRGNAVVLMECKIALAENKFKKYMVVEQFHPDKVKELYERFEKRGRLLPKGVKYIDSWIDEKVETCFQLMESESLEALQQWTDEWNDLASFKIVPVITSRQAKEKVF